jgi:hypothetical protein
VAVTPTFTERLATRRRLWWDPPWPGRGRTVGDALHRLSERRTHRRRDDPDEAWRCCAFWPRTLLNKWNGREFAARHGCPLPELYWHGSDRSAPAPDALPDAFVIKPEFGANKQGVAVVVEGEERLRGGPVTNLRLGRSSGGRPHRPMPILIEEFVRPDSGDGWLPLECKLHVFASEVAAVELVTREAAHVGMHRYYTPDWEPIEDEINTFLPPDEALRARPRSLAAMLDLASAIGGDLDTYMRIDLFLTAGGFRFNEFSSLPLGGGYNTPRCDRWFGELWAAHCADAT